MKIEVLQIEVEGKNKFQIFYNGKLQYLAETPFVSIQEPFNIDKIRKIKIFDENHNLVYKTDYQYVENLKEELIPMKYLATDSQKFNQLIFQSMNHDIKIYYEKNDIWKSRYVIEFNHKLFFCYYVEDGYVKHFPIYEGESQIGEALKSNVVIDRKDKYCCYLKDDFSFLADAVVCLLLYLDCNLYSSSYLVHQSYTLEKGFTYQKNNSYYDANWVKNNFGDEYFLQVQHDIDFVKEKFRHPFKTFGEQLQSMSVLKRRLLLIIALPWIIILIVAIIIFIAIINS